MRSRVSSQTPSLWTRPGVASAAAQPSRVESRLRPTIRACAHNGRPVLLRRCLSGFIQAEAWVRARFRPCRIPSCSSADQTEICAIARVPGQPTSGRCSTDESVVSRPVARHRHPILPWALVPFEVHCHRRRSDRLSHRGALPAAPTIPSVVFLPRASPSSSPH
jgi:hypothetical protein